MIVVGRPGDRHARRGEALAERVDVVDAQGEVRRAGIAAGAGSSGRPVRRDVLDHLEQLTAAEVELGVAHAHAAQAR